MELAIKGHPKRGKEVLQLLAMLGGKTNDWGRTGRCEKTCYFINNKGYIEGFHLMDHKSVERYKIMTLEEFEQQFPYKIGDKVYCDNCLFYNDDGFYTVSNPFELIHMEWNSYYDTLTCEIKKGNTILITTADTIKPLNFMKKEVKELKDYIKPGHVIEHDDSTRFIITQDAHGHNFGLQLGAAVMWDSLDRLDTVVKVYQIDRPGALHRTHIHDTHLTLVWEKPTEVELTMQEIADKFGIDVNQLKIKK